MTFLGLEIPDVSRYTTSSKVTQWGSDQLEADMAAALKHCDLITWIQYTPYFNDGDACLFSAYEPVFYKADLTAEEFARSADPWEAAEGDYEGPAVSHISVRKPYDILSRRAEDVRQAKRTGRLHSFGIRYTLGLSAGEAETPRAVREAANKWLADNEEAVANERRSIEEWAPPHESIMSLHNDWAHYEQALNNLFGDPSFVVVTSDAIVVEAFEHE